MKRIQIGKAFMGLVFLAFLAPLAASDKHPSSASWSSSSAASSIVAESERKEREQKINVDGYERDAKEQAAQGSSEQDDVRPNSLFQICLNKLAELVTTKTSHVTGSTLNKAIEDLAPITMIAENNLGKKLKSNLEHENLWHSSELVWEQELKEKVKDIFIRDGETTISAEILDRRPTFVLDGESAEESDGEFHDGWSEHAWDIETGKYQLCIQTWNDAQHEAPVDWDQSPNKLYIAKLEEDYTITLRDAATAKILFTIQAPAHKYGTISLIPRNRVTIRFINDTDIRVTNDDYPETIVIHHIDYATKTSTTVYTLLKTNHQLIYADDNKKVVIGHIWLKNGIIYFFDHATFTTSILGKNVVDIHHPSPFNIVIKQKSGEIIVWNLQHGLAAAKKTHIQGDAVHNKGRYLAHTQLLSTNRYTDDFTDFAIDIFDVTTSKKLGTINHTFRNPLEKIQVALSSDGTRIAVLCTTTQKQYLQLWKASPAQPLDPAYLCKEALKNSKTEDELLDLLRSPYLLQLPPAQRKPITDEIFALLAEMNNEHADEGESNEKNNKKRKAKEIEEDGGGEDRSPKLLKKARKKENND